MTEEIAFSDWSKRLEHADHSNDLNDENGSEAAANSWLPAYGFHQPAVLQQAFLQNKTVEFYNNGECLFFNMDEILFRFNVNCVKNE